MRIFLSYASERRAVAEAITFALRGRGHEVFLDKSDLPPGGNYDARIERAIEDCDLMIFLVSPESVAPERFTLSELSFARHKWPSARGRVLPVMVAPTPVAAIPAYLTSIHIMQPEGNVAAEVASVVQRMAPRVRPERLLPAAFGIGVSTGIASVLPIPNPFNAEAVKSLLPSDLANLLGMVFINNVWHAPWVFALGIVTMLALWGRVPLPRMAALIVPAIALGWAVAYWTAFGMVAAGGVTESLPAAKVCGPYQSGTTTDEDGGTVPVYRDLTEDERKLCEATRTYADELLPRLTVLKWHLYTLAGMTAGFIGSAFTALGLATASARFRTIDAVGTVVLTGTLAGALLNEKLLSVLNTPVPGKLFAVWQATVPVPGLLFIVWQAAVAVAIARTLTKEAT